VTDELPPRLPQTPIARNRGYWINPSSATDTPAVDSPLADTPAADTAATDHMLSPIASTAGLAAAASATTIPVALGPGIDTRRVDAAPARSARAGTRASRSRKSRKSRKRRLWRLAILSVVLAGIAIALALVFTGRTVVPGVSNKVFPIYYQEDIARVAGQYDLDPYMVAAVAKTESGFNHEAVSPAGAVGLMQLMPTTAEWITGLEIWQGQGDPELTDPADNLALGACYLAYLEERFDGEILAVLAAYNGGPTNVGEWVETAGGLDEFGLSDIPFEETRDFVQRVQRYWFLYERVHPDAFTATDDAA
jgi:peptidoglycan lytic transglycosylase